MIDGIRERGRYYDIIIEALLDYDEWMKDDDYNSTTALNKIMKRMRERLEMSDPPPRLEVQSEEPEYPHEVYCNASRKVEIGGDACSCRAGREIKRLRAALGAAQGEISAEQARYEASEPWPDAPLRCQCEACQRDQYPHASDCAVHNGPALPVGTCTCRPAQAGADRFNRKQVEAVCRAVCEVEGIDPDSDVYDSNGSDPQWSRYADAVAKALAIPSAQQLPPDWKRAAATDRCAGCGYPLSEHSYNGACYGVCGEFVCALPSTHSASPQE